MRAPATFRKVLYQMTYLSSNTIQIIYSVYNRQFVRYANFISELFVQSIDYQEIYASLIRLNVYIRSSNRRYPFM